MNRFCIILSLVVAATALELRAQDLKFRQEIKPMVGSINLFKEPCDVAVFSPDGGPRHLFVADRVAGGVFRFKLGPSGQYLNNYTFWPEILLGQPTAIAVNDNPCHANYGQVYVGAHHSMLNVGMLGVYDLTGTLLMTVSMPTNDFMKISGISVDTAGNVYVTDQNRKRIVKFDSLDFDPSHYYASWLVNPVTEYQPFVSHRPLDIAVGKSGLVYVTHDCGCLLAYHNNGTGLWGGSGMATNYTSVDAHDANEGIWVSAGPPKPCSTIAQRIFFADRWSSMTWSVDAKTIPNVFGNPNLNCAEKLEYRRFWPTPTSSSANAFCYERLFVADTGNKRVAMYGEPHTSTVHPNDMVAWWKFEGCGSYLEEEINQNNGGFLFGGPYVAYPRLFEGMVRRGVYFSASGDGAAVPENDTLDFGTKDFTIEAWVCTRDGVGTGVRNIVDKRDVIGSSTTGYALFLYDGMPGVQIGVGTFANYISSQSIADARWHHVAAVVRRVGINKFVKIFVDGQVALGGYFSNPLQGDVGNHHDLLMGTHPTLGPGFGFTGGLDELSLYNRGLADHEIIAIFNAGCAGKKD